jgi:enediyne biosynthesis protein E4
MRRVTAGRRSLIALGAVVAIVVLVAAAVLPLLRSAGALPAPQFVEEAVAAGLQHRYDGEFMFFVGGGVAIFDCDDDGLQDLFIAGGAEPAALFRNESPVGGALAFSAVPSAATDLEQVVGAYPLDIDGDGIDDLAVLRLGENVLLRGMGGCAFERANEAWGFEGGSSWTAAFSATWESPDALPTLAFGNYLVPESVDDGTYVCDQHELVRPDSDGEAYGRPTALAPGWCTLSMLFSGWDRSGRRDLRVSNDRHYNRFGQEQLWRFERGEAPRAWTREEGWQAVRIWGMGIASQDLTGDGYPEVYLTSQADNKLQTLADGPEQPTYEDVAIRTNANASKPYAGDTGMLSTAWHAEFQDTNNDGFVDLFVSKGNVEAQPDYAARDPNNLLIGQPDGTFVEGAQDAGITTFERARGAGLADLNLDGLLDLVVVNRRANVSLWRNVGAGTGEAPEPMGNWIAIRLAENGANRDAIGAWVEVTAGDRVISREVTVGGGHAGGQLGWIHLGIGEAERAAVRVTWPDGEEGQAIEIDANTFSVVERGAEESIPWQPAGG